MYNIDKPMLVFDGPCYTPAAELFYGWGFNLYEFNADKPRGLLFSHVSEAVMFARRLGALFIMDPRAAPSRVTALEYVLSRQDEADFPAAPEDGRSKNIKTPEQLEQAVRQLASMHGFGEGRIREILDGLAQAQDADEDETETEGRYGVDWVGSATGYGGGRVRPHGGPVDAGDGGGFASVEELDWFAGD